MKLFLSVVAMIGGVLLAADSGHDVLNVVAVCGGIGFGHLITKESGR